MADLENLIASLPSTLEAPIECDRAIFTSLPSPTGEGYRLVSWSAGVRSEERVELTRRAPSHDSILDETRHGRATMVTRLASSGRVMVLLARHAGEEHTRRGGSRVWSDILLLTAADYARIGSHPFPLGEALAHEPIPKIAARGSSVGLGRMLLSNRLPAYVPALCDSVPAERVAGMAASLVSGRETVAAAGPNCAALVASALAMLPSCLRGHVDFAAGLRVSRARQVRTTVVERLDLDVQRATRGQRIECLDEAELSVGLAPAWAPWLRLMARWWGTGRTELASRLADRLSAGWDQGAVARLVGLCDAIDRQEEAPDALVSFLMRRAAA